jgi:hypothetical protein
VAEVVKDKIPNKMIIPQLIKTHPTLEIVRDLIRNLLVYLRIMMRRADTTRKVNWMTMVMRTLINMMRIYMERKLTMAMRNGKEALGSWMP